MQAAKRRPQAETLSRILLAAEAEFAARGLAGAQMETIAREAGVTKALLYYYYGSKPGLYEAVLGYLTEEIHQDLAALRLSEMDPAEAIPAFFGAIFDLFARKPLLVPIAFDFNLRSADQSRGRTYRSVFGVMEQIIDRAIAAGTLAADTDKRDCFSFPMLIISGSFWGQDRSWGHETSGAPDLAELARQKAVVLKMVDAIIHVARR